MSLKCLYWLSLACAGLVVFVSVLPELLAVWEVVNRILFVELSG
jgi:hypothetical protein